MGRYAKYFSDNESSNRFSDEPLELLSSNELPETQQQESGRTLGGVMGDVALSGLKSAINLPQAIVGVADIATKGKAGKFLEENVGYRPEEAKQYIDTLYTPEQQQANEAVHQADGFIDTSKALIQNPSVIGHTVVESLAPSIAGGLAGRFIKGVSPAIAAGIGEGTIAAGSTAEGIREQTDNRELTGKQALLAAGAGLGTGLIGGGSAALAGSKGLRDFESAIAGKVTPASDKGLWRRVGEGAAIEGLVEELPQSVQEQALQNIALDKPYDEGLGSAAAMGAFTGAAMGGAFNAPPVQDTPPADTPPPATQQQTQQTKPRNPKTPLSNAVNQLQPQLENQPLFKDVTLTDGTILNTWNVYNDVIDKTGDEALAKNTVEKLHAGGDLSQEGINQYHEIDAAYRQAKATPLDTTEFQQQPLGLLGRDNVETQETKQETQETGQGVAGNAGLPDGIPRLGYDQSVSTDDSGVPEQQQPQNTEGRSDNSAVSGEAELTDELLSDYTNEDIVEQDTQQQQQEQAQQELADEQKRQADAEVDTLVDEMLGNTGNQDLFNPLPETQDDNVSPIVASDTQNPQISDNNQQDTITETVTENTNEQTETQSEETQTTAQPAAESVDQSTILKQSKKKYINAQIKAFKKQNPNARKVVLDAKIQEIEDNYPDELERAEASLPFEQYRELPGNKGLPESILRQAYDGVREDLGIQDEVESELSGTEKETEVENNTVNTDGQNKPDTQPDSQKTSDVNTESTDIAQNTPRETQNEPVKQSGEIKLTSKGNPFKTEKSAQAAAKNQRRLGNYEVVPIEGGYGLRLVDDAQDATDSNVTNSSQDETESGEKIRVSKSSKSVGDNTQQAIINNNEITIVNKSGRKTLLKKSFPLNKWEELDSSFGNPNYNKREFIKKLETVFVDDTPEASSLKERIIDSQISAINSAFEEYKKQSNNSQTSPTTNNAESQTPKSEKGVDKSKPSQENNPASTESEAGRVDEGNTDKQQAQQDQDVEKSEKEAINKDKQPELNENTNANKLEIIDENIARTEQSSDDAGKTSNQSGVSAKESRPVKQAGDKQGSGRVPTGQGFDDAADTLDSQGNGVSTNSGLAGQQTDVGSQSNVRQSNGDYGRISGSARVDNDGGNNLSLVDKPNISLTPAKRRDVNNLAIEILKKPVNDITEADKEVLRQYTGSGGLSAKDSVDKGAGIFNQHYTDYTTIKEMYRAMDDAGIKINTALEPSVGSGNFIGMFPNADWSAVDIDKTNTEVVKRLYPKVKVSNESYETFKGKNFDLIISNVPFASFSSLPREHANTVKPGFKAIHNFFFAQSVDKLKTNGIMAFMTSTGTMDGITEAKKLREHLVSKMDVIGAFRLPMGTQKANASTEVMIDVIFLQKRPENMESLQPEKNESFVNVVKKDGHKINQYFVDYPDSVLGDLSIGKNKTSMGKVGWIVTGKADYSKMKIEKQDYTSSKKAEQSEFRDSVDAASYAEKNGLFFINGESKPWFDASDGVAYDKVISFSDQEGNGVFGRKVKGINADKLAALKEIEDTLNPNLVEAYKEKFEKSPHKDKQLKIWAKGKYADKKLNSYLSLFDENFNLSEIFTEQVRFKDSGKIEVTSESPLIDRAESLEDVDGIFITDNNLVSNDEIQSLLDSGEYTRISDTKVQNARLYYAGNIYKKIDELSRVKPASQRNKQLSKLNERKPKLIPIEHITIKGKEAWLPSSAIASLGKRTYPDGVVMIGENAIDDNHFLHLFNQYINGDVLVKKDSNDTPEEHNDKIKAAQSTLTNEVLPLIKQKLIDDGLADEVVEAFNRSKNFFAVPVFDGSSLKNLPKTFRGKDFKLMQHQQEGAERAIYNKKGVLAFAPGLGKTPTAIVVTDQLLQKGVIKKPLFIVPANTIPQWENTARELYPNAKVFEFPKYKTGVNKGKVKDWVAMNAADKEKMVNDLTNNRYDYTFISTNLAQKFTVPENDLRRYIDDLTESISGMEKPDDELSKSQIKAKEKRLAKLAMLKATMMTAYRDDAQNGFDMEKLGFDAIIADEVQYYKNIGMQSEDAKGGIGANVTLNSKFPKGEDGKPNKDAAPLSVTLGSSRSYDFRFKTQYISENNNGNNVFLLTGTPTPNKPLELLTLLHHLDTKILDEYGINNVGEFVDEFLEITEVEELDLAGKAKMSPQLTEIKNIDALKKIITRYVDYRSPESAKDLKRPKQVDIKHTILKNDAAETIFADIQGRLMKAIEDSKRKMQGEKVDDAEAIIQMYTAGRDASIDVRLYTPTEKSEVVAPGSLFEEETREDYSKIAKTVSLIAKQNAKEPDSGQIVFLDRLKFAGGNGSTHADIRDKVIKATGLAPNEVVYVNGGEHVNPNTGTVVNSGTKPERLQAIIDAYNSGQIKVIIGNTSKLGVGVDLQVTTTDIYQIDKPYRPDEIEQRNNRGVRQGNRNDEVRVHTFNQPGTFDEMSDRIIANKQGFNDVFWKDQDNDKADVSAQGTPDAYEAAIEIQQDPVKKQKLRIERDLSNAKSKQTAIEKQISSLAKRIRIANKNKDDFNSAIEGIDTRAMPEYKDQSPAERKKSIAAFKKRMKEQRAKHVKRIADIEIDLKELVSDKESRIAELEEHKQHIQSIREKYVVNGVVSLDAIKNDDFKEGRKFSKSPTKKSGNLASQIKDLLTQKYRSVKKMLAAGTLEVVQSVEDLPKHLQEAGRLLFHKAWHGSISKFEQFDAGLVGKANGTEGGWGVYVSSVKDVAEGYAEPWLYNVDIKNHEHEYLDFDKPLSEQTDYIKQILINNDLMSDITGEELYDQIWDEQSDQQEASKYLLSLGIKGNTYLEGTYNPGSPNHLEAPRTFVVYDANKIDVLRNEKYSQDLGSIEGLYDPETGKTYLVADMLTKSNLDSIFQHEMLHKALAENPQLKQRLESNIGGLRKIFDDLQAGKYKGRYNDIYGKAMGRVKDAKTKPSDEFEEFMAYLVTLHNQNPKSLPAKLAKAIKDFIATIRALLYKATGLPMKLTPADLSALARQAINANNTAKGGVIAKASQQGYKGNDKGEAEEWLRAKAKGLDMSHEARMERAKAMGFDVDNVIYTGARVNSNNNNSKLTKVTDPEKKEFERTVFGSSSSSVASSYTGVIEASEDIQHNLFVSGIRKAQEMMKSDDFQPTFIAEELQERFDMTDDEIVDFYIDNDIEPTDLYEFSKIMDITAFSENGSFMIPFYAQKDKLISIDAFGSNWDRVVYENEADEFIELLQEQVKKISKEAMTKDEVIDILPVSYDNGELSYELSTDDLKDIAKQLREFGVKGVIVKNVIDSTSEVIEEKADTYIITNSSGARSINAAFDPDYADSGNLLASTEPKLSRASDSMDSINRWFNGAPLSESVGSNLGLADESRVEKFTKLFQDGFNRVKTLQETIKARGGVVNDLNNVYLAEERSSSVTPARLDDLTTDYVDPITDAMADNGLTLQQVDDYVMAKHADERNEYIASINDDMQDGGSGLTNEQAEEKLAEFEQQGLTEKLESVAGLVYEMNGKTLDVLFADGLIDADTYHTLKNQYKYYVPLKGKDGVDERGGTGQGYSIGSSGLKAAMGRGAGNIAESPLAHSVAQAENAIIRAEKNRIGQTLIRLMKDNPDPGFWSVTETNYNKFIALDGTLFEGFDELPAGLKEKQDVHRVMAYTAKEIKQAKEEGRKPKKKAVYKIDPAYKYRKDVFSVMAEGKLHQVTLKDEILAEQLKKLNTNELNHVLKNMGSLNRFLAMINTALNPEFVITNLQRDLQAAGINLAGEHSAGMAKQVMMDVPAAAKGIFKYMFKHEGYEDNEWSKLYDEMRHEGGTIGFFGLEDIDTKVKNIQKKLTIDDSYLGKTKKGLTTIKDAIMDANASVENAARLAAYKAAKDKKMSKKQAASLAKNLTVNFNRRGEYAPVINSAYLFANASIQGTARLFTALKHPKVRKIVGGIASASFALAMYNMAAGGDDEDGISKWEKLGGTDSDYLKQTHLIIMHPDGSGNYFKWKMPYGYNVFWYAGTALHDLMFGQKTTTLGQSGKLLTTMMNAFNPIQGADFLDTLTPTVLKPIEQDVRNINHMMTPIKPENPFDRYDRPESDKAFFHTNSSLKELSKFLNEATGGNDTKSGMIDISPETIKHYIGWLTGGAGMTVYRSLSGIGKLATGEGIEAKQIPFIRTLGGSVGTHFDTENFYSAVQDIEARKEQHKRYQQAGDREQVRDYFKENGRTIALGKLANRYKKRLKVLRNRKRMAARNGHHDRAKAIKEEMAKVMRQFIKRYNAVQ